MMSMALLQHDTKRDPGPSPAPLLSLIGGCSSRPVGPLSSRRLAEAFSTASVLDIDSRKSYLPGMKAVVSEKGQVTIPKRLRDRLGIRPGQVLDFDEEAGRLVARKAVREDPLEALYGSLDVGGRTPDELIVELRGPADIP